jgi:hypothetical protein
MEWWEQQEERKRECGNLQEAVICALVSDLPVLNGLSRRARDITRCRLLSDADVRSLIDLGGALATRLATLQAATRQADELFFERRRPEPPAKVPAEWKPLQTDTAAVRQTRQSVILDWLDGFLFSLCVEMRNLPRYRPLTSDKLALVFSVDPAWVLIAGDFIRDSIALPARAEQASEELVQRAHFDAVGPSRVMPAFGTTRKVGSHRAPS